MMVPHQKIVWNRCSDFTGGQASDYRRHILNFPKGSLTAPIEFLLIIEPSLRAMAMRGLNSAIDPHFSSPARFDNIQLNPESNLIESTYPDSSHTGTHSAPELPTEDGPQKKDFQKEQTWNHFDIPLHYDEPFLE